MYKQNEISKELHVLLRALKKNWRVTRRRHTWCLQKLIRKLTDYFFMILDLGAASFGNGYLFTELKGNSPLIKKLGQCILILKSILPIVVEYLKCLKNNVNENIQCDHGYAYYSGKNKMCAWVNEESWAMMKTCFTDANKIKKPQKHFMQRMYICSQIWKWKWWDFLFPTR